MKVLSDRRGEGGGITWLVRHGVHGHVDRPEYPHAIVTSGDGVRDLNPGRDDLLTDAITGDCRDLVRLHGCMNPASSADGSEVST